MKSSNTISYSKRISTKKHYVISYEKDVIGVFTTLKKACDFMDGEDFPSYWTIVRSMKWKERSNGIRKFEDRKYNFLIFEVPFK